MSLVIGEALIDIVTASAGATTEYVGGSPLNVAVGLGRLGRPVEFVTRIGDDTRGWSIVRHLEESGVSLAPGSVTAERTATAHATLDSAGAATYEFDIEWDLPSPSGASAPTLVHTGSIAAVMEPGCDVVADMLDRRRSSATLSYDPNVRPVLITDRERALRRIEHLVTMSDIVKVSDEDLRWYDGDRDPVDIARDWLSRGPAMVAVTRGAEGAFAVCAAGLVEVAARPVEVVDTVGAGDAFMAGLLDGFWAHGFLGAESRAALHAIEPDELRNVLDNAVLTSGLTVARAGADLPTRDTLDRAAGVRQ
ncbi:MULTISPECIES: carbohydrate kinase [unclassified Rhodococcus (in: high G+C Gram-positive bacteria)]|uniref:carbohydrate kinase family protein n=1 Tax=unclassified Rhodococcus (in: high G+C Gram-positive bacteria) TaxID=192944 RepID=UPI00163A1A42|nr:MULTISPECIES: carbohydrate kinase [unclassified Rhodococcus (in: high G+C Gram-positive bacteria)]MBC2640293.1 carbohydrate kinase [Rhodococcus sp. 3A]MBC2894961.1 carbohydrate kinase [Rhodococcus sp. 4CII]